MLKNIISGLLAATMAIAGSAMAQSKQIKIGVIFDMSGALAAGGSNASYLGTKYAIDIINERGQVIESITTPHTPESMAITLACTVPFAHQKAHH